MPYCSRLRAWTVPLCCTLAVLAAGRAPGADPSARPDFHTGLEAGYEAAAADHALILAVFGADWCGPCKLLQSNTLDAADFLDQAGALHVARVDSDANPKTAAAFNVEAIPSLVLLTEDRKIIAHRTGYLTARELLDWLADGEAAPAGASGKAPLPATNSPRFPARPPAPALIPPIWPASPACWKNPTRPNTPSSRACS